MVANSMPFQSESTSHWFERLSRGTKATLCLFCFPYAGGSANVFRSWQRSMPADADLCLVHLPGRGKRISDPPFTRMKALVNAIADEIGPEIQRPFAFYGHSMGAVIAFELARELRLRHGIEPAALFLSGRRAPQMLRSRPPGFDLPDDQFVAELRRFSGTPKEVLADRNLLELFLPVIRADFQAIETYEYHTEPPLSCPMTIYGGLRDIDVAIQDLEMWHEHTTGEFQARLFSGSHFFIQGANNSDFLKVLSRDLSATLLALQNDQLPAASV